MLKSFRRCFHFLFLRVNKFSSCGLPCIILVPTFIPIYRPCLCIFLLKRSLQKYPGKKIIYASLKSKSFFPCTNQVRRRDGLMSGVCGDSVTCISIFFSYLHKISGTILRCYHFYLELMVFVFGMTLNFKHRCQAFYLLLAFWEGWKDIVICAWQFLIHWAKNCTVRRQRENVENDLFPCVCVFFFF